MMIGGKPFSLLSPADYERARLCVNFCAGVSSESLTSCAQAAKEDGYDKPLAGMIVTADRCIQQREVLIAACQAVVSDPFRISVATRNMVREALDRVANLKETP